MADIVKVSMNIPKKELDAIKKVASKRGTSVTDAIRRALLMEQFLTEEEEKGNKLLIEDKDKNLRQVVRK
ncbi:MAG: ribbon-helix-helix protein, CopG family [Rhodospirillaceae bacterium]|nr:ribbon-helix-helix protein, CopG family [Rhodospirillaceae bacterium]